MSFSYDENNGGAYTMIYSEAMRDGSANIFKRLMIQGVTPEMLEGLREASRRMSSPESLGPSNRMDGDMRQTVVSFNSANAMLQKCACCGASGMSLKLGT